MNIYYGLLYENSKFVDVLTATQRLGKIIFNKLDDEVSELVCSKSCYECEDVLWEMELYVPVYAETPIVQTLIINLGEIEL